jgi:hypothetical protein
MEIKIKYHIEVIGLIAAEEQHIITCDSLASAEKKMKSLRKQESHMFLIKTVTSEDGCEQFIID